MTKQFETPKYFRIIAIRNTNGDVIDSTFFAKSKKEVKYQTNGLETAGFWVCYCEEVEI